MMNQPLTDDHFSTVAENYSLFRPLYPSDLFMYLTSLVNTHDLAWDCGTGNGQAAIALVRYFNRVFATDISDKQIAHAEKHERIEYISAQAHKTNLDDQSVDIITVAQALHWFDLPAFFKETRRVLKPGGILAVWMYGKMKVDDTSIQNIINNFYTNIIGSYWPEQRIHIDNQYASLDFPFNELTTPAFKIESALVLEELTGYIRTWSATRNYSLAHQHDPVSILEKELISCWDEPDFPVTVHWPITLRVGRI